MKVTIFSSIGGTLPIAIMESEMDMATLSRTMDALHNHYKIRIRYHDGGCAIVITAYQPLEKVLADMGFGDSLIPYQ